MSGPADWCLSFDCATKSFAFALLRVRDPRPSYPAWLARLEEASGDEIGEILHEIDAETKECLHLEAGGAADLVPGKANRDIHTVERIRAVITYLKTVVDPALESAKEKGCPAQSSRELNVMIEFQMGVNAKARAVAIALLSHYPEATVFFVGPAFKNQLWYPSRPEIRHPLYVQKYSKLYDANKEHSKDLYFKHIAEIFGHTGGEVLKKIPTKFRRDFADCVTQVLGFRKFGDPSKAAEMF